MNSSEAIIYQALKAKYEAKRLKSLANINVLMGSPVGVAEHPDIVATLSSEIEELANADEIVCYMSFITMNQVIWLPRVTTIL